MDVGVPWRGPGGELDELARGPEVTGVSEMGGSRHQGFHAARKGTREEQLHELGDVIAWVTSLANQLGLSMTEAIERYADGCPRCCALPCVCALKQ